MPQPCDPSDQRATRAAFQPGLDARGLAAGWQEFFEIMTNWVLRTSGGSSIIFPRDADVAQLVEHDLAKVGVAGSNPVVRSIDRQKAGYTEEVWPAFFLTKASGDVAKW